MKRNILWMLLSFLLVAGLVLASCAPAVPGEQEEEEEEEEEEPLVDQYEEYVAGLQEGEFSVPRECFEQAIEEGKLYLYDWAEWWPEEIFEGFSEEFGIEITRDHLASVEEVLAKFALNPETPYDLIIAGMAPLTYSLQKLGAVGQLNHDWLPNVLEYIPEKYFDCKYDPGWKTSVNCSISSVNYQINTKFVDDPRLPSWAVLFEPMEEVKGKITLASRVEFVIGAALKYLGYHWYSDDEAELMEARDLLMALKPHLLAFDSWPVTLALQDEVWIIHETNGGGWFLNAEYEAIVPVLPTEGSDFAPTPFSFAIASPNPAAAHLFLNYVFRPEVMTLLIEATFFFPIHTAVLELLSEEVREKVMFPEWYLAKLDHFDPRAFEGKGLELRIAIWEELRR